MVKKTSAQAVYVTADEAVARLINIPTLPSTCSLLELLSDFVEVAETSLSNASIERKTVAERRALERKQSVCLSRQDLAQDLLEGIRVELQSDIPRIRTEPRSFVGRLDWQSVREWALDEFEIALASEPEKTIETQILGDHAKYSEKLLASVGPKGWGRLKTINMLGTFYFLAYQYATRNRAKYLEHDQLAPDPLSEQIAKEMAAEFPKLSQSDQSASVIKLRIQAAREVLRSLNDER